MTSDAYIEIDTKNINMNIEKIVNKYNDYKYYIGVVKGNCYGHGMNLVKSIVNSKINYLAVSTLQEALEIRQLVDLPILCMQKVELNDLEVASKNNITITISSFEYYKKIINKKIQLKVHLKLDTGMNRLGLNNKAEIEIIYKNLIKNKNIHLEGIYTHLQSLGIFDTKWNHQIDTFVNLTSEIDLQKLDIVHIYSTNSLCYHPKLSFCNGVRIGILMYGICPRPINYVGIKGSLRKYKHTYLRKKNNIDCIINGVMVDVKPAFKLISKVIEIKKVKKGEYIGYGFKYKTLKDELLAVISIGYADGIPLTHSGGYVYINKKRYQIVGSINMKMLTAIVDENVHVEDKVEIINDNVREFCLHNNITPHFLYTSIPSNIKRNYI